MYNVFIHNFDFIQVLMLNKLKKKAEIESLTTFTQTYLTEVYITKKVINQEYIQNLV